VTADGSTIATIPWDIVSNVWSTSADASAAPEQWTSGMRVDGSLGMSVPADTRLVFASADGIDVGIWSVDAPGGRLRQLTREYAEVPATPDDGRFIAYQAIHEGRFRIWRMQPDGSDPRVLSRGEDDIAPLVSPDGKWIFYSATGTPSGLMRMPAEGGDPVRLTEQPFLSVDDISHDGTELLARVVNPTSDKSSAATHLVLDAQSGATRAELIVPGGYGTRARFGRQPGLITYQSEKDGVDNLWEQPAAGGTPRQLTHFTSGRIYNFAYAAGRKRLFIARGQRTGDVVLIRNFR
jgi:Tol biopolymer transport system component